MTGHVGEYEESLNTCGIGIKCINCMKTDLSLTLWQVATAYTRGDDSRSLCKEKVIIRPLYFINDCLQLSRGANVTDWGSRGGEC